MRTARCLLWTMVVTCAALAVAPTVWAKRPPPKPAVAATPPPPLPKPWPVERVVLANGLRVLVHTDRSAPLVGIGLLVQSGARDEQQGRAGLAHFFEHMMFQGSEHVAPMEHMRAIEAQGGSVNAHTGYDATFYHAVVPREAVELALWLEADRLAHLKLQAAGVDLQRKAVLAEMAERIDNQPGVRAVLQASVAAYDRWEMGHPVIGSAADLQATPLGDFAAFWTRHYAASNCVLVLSGDVDLAAVRPLLDRTVGLVPSRPKAAKTPVAETLQAARKVEQVADPLLQLPTAIWAWKVPPFVQEDGPALDLLAHLLGGGPSSRLEQRLVRQQPLATACSAAVQGRRDADLLLVQADVAGPSPAALAQVRQAVWQELLQVARDGVGADELRRTQLAFEVAWLRAASQPEQRAELLAQAEIELGDAAQLAMVLPRYRAVTPDDIRRVARRWLTWDRAVEVDGVPAAWPKSGPAAKPGWVRKAEQAIAADEARRAAAAMAAADEARRKAAEPARAVAPAVPPAEPVPQTAPAPLAADATPPTTPSPPAGRGPEVPR